MRNGLLGSVEVVVEQGRQAVMCHKVLVGAQGQVAARQVVCAAQAIQGARGVRVEIAEAPRLGVDEPPVHVGGVDHLLQDAPRLAGILAHRLCGTGHLGLQAVDVVERHGRLVMRVRLDGVGRDALDHAHESRAREGVLRALIGIAGLGNRRKAVVALEALHDAASLFFAARALENAEVADATGRQFGPALLGQDALVELDLAHGLFTGKRLVAQVEEGLHAHEPAVRVKTEDMRGTGKRLERVGLAAGAAVGVDEHGIELVSAQAGGQHALRLSGSADLTDTRQDEEGLGLCSIGRRAGKLLRGAKPTPHVHPNLLDIGACPETDGRACQKREGSVAARKPLAHFLVA